jgi:hypothetical protein
MIGPHLQSASNTLDVIVQSGDWRRDEKLKNAAMQLKRVLESVDQSPELQAAYRATVDAYAAYTAHVSEVSKG